MLRAWGCERTHGKRKSNVHQSRVSFCTGDYIRPGMRLPFDIQNGKNVRVSFLRIPVFGGLNWKPRPKENHQFGRVA